MTILTIIARVSNTLMLAEDMESDFAENTSKSSDLETYRSQAKNLVKTLSRKSENRLTIESGPYYFAYIIENDICYLTLCERSYPRKLAFKFLEELQKEFDIQYGADVQNAKRPYAFIKFGK